jgi:hypothetical protein
MNRLQRSFFTRHYRPAFEAGVAMELDEEYGYAVVMLHELVAVWEAEPDRAMEGLRRIVDAYPRTSISSEARHCHADIHYLRGEWAEALEETQIARCITPPRSPRRPSEVPSTCAAFPLQ